MIFGYPRVSTSDQQLHLQTVALQAPGCAGVAQEKVSSVKARPALQHLLTRLRPAQRPLQGGSLQSPGRGATLLAAE